MIKSSNGAYVSIVSFARPSLYFNNFYRYTKNVN